MAHVLINKASSRIILLPVIFCASLAWLYLLSVSIPSFEREGARDDEGPNELIKFPNNLDELKLLANLLRKYFQHHQSYVLLLFASAYLFKQTFAIPGSVFLNMLSGALFGLNIGFSLCCILTATGASCCYLLSNFCAKNWILHYFPSQIRSLQHHIDKNRSSLIYYLLFTRLFPMTPNWFLNIASPIVGIPIHLFFISVLIGLMPYNFICVQTGCLLSSLNSLDDVFTWNTLLTLMIIAIVALIPGIIMKRRQNKLPCSESKELTVNLLKENRS